jgi:TonB-dependent Receptor Plug Domain
VTVNAQPSTLDPSQSSVVSSVDQERIEELPVRSRNYLDFVLLAPGVSSSPTASGASVSTPLTGSGFTFGGLRSRSNNLSIDGLDNNDEYTGSSRTELSPEIVQEFQVVNNGLSAESGGASGGSINVTLVPGQTQSTATRSYLRRTVHSMHGTRSKLRPANHHFGASALALLWADRLSRTRRFTTPQSNKSTTEGKSALILTRP